MSAGHILLIAFAITLLNGGQAAPLSSTAQITGSYRKDFYLEHYHEQGTVPPTAGGRVHITVTNTTCQEPIKSAQINGQDMVNLPNDEDIDFTYFDWARVHVDKSTRVAWLSFHSRNKDWLDGSSPSLKVSISDATGSCFDGSVTVNSQAPVTATSITTRKQGAELLIHLRNDGTTSQTVTSMAVNGASHPGTTVEAGQNAIVVVPMNPPLQPGNIWSVSFDKVGYGGRTLPEYFPVMVWPHSNDCPIVGVPGSESNAGEALKLGINSVFDDKGACDKMDPGSTADNLAKKDLPMRVALELKYASKVQNRSHVASVFIGDEVDGKLNGNLRDPTPAQANRQFPELPTYQGGKTNTNIGAYAGITDIQGMDAYIGACAPTIVPVIHAAGLLPLQYPFYYLKNARNNQMPHPTWLYSQFYSQAWSYQCNENEVVAQIAMTVTAGGKGTMLFQFLQEAISQHATKPIQASLRAILAQGELIRTGDIGGAKITSSGGTVMLEAIRTPEKLLLVAVNMNAHGYSNLACHALLGRHWNFKDTTVDKVELTVPDGLKLSNAQEQIGSDLKPVSDVKVSYTSSGAKLKNLDLDAKGVVRFFVFDTSTK